MSQYNKFQKKKCGFYFAKLDYEILRPLLIYKYDREEMHRQDQFIDIMLSDANLLGSVYGKMDFELLQSNDESMVYDRVSIAI